jgi:hypothetical protein
MKDKDMDMRERRAAATPHDHVLDFAFQGGFETSTCGRCLHYFRGFVYRSLCKLCEEAETGVHADAETEA